ALRWLARSDWYATNRVNDREFHRGCQRAEAVLPTCYTVVCVKTAVEIGEESQKHGLDSPEKRRLDHLERDPHR
ncbi:MAG: hypothetical protein ACXVBV_21750, partial [Isosphaeraceae bacterium]